MPDHQHHAIRAPRLFDGERWLQDHCLLIEGDQIATVCPREELPGGVPLHEVSVGTLAPGFVDLQVNGGGGVLFNNAPTAQTLQRITSAHRRCGTTALMPTLVSDTPAVHRAGVDAVAEAIADGNAGVLGVHIEGPFFAPARRGAHQQEMIREFGQQDLDWLCSLTHLSVMLTLAPEQVSGEQIRAMSDAGLLLCAGHTDASYQQVRSAIDSGLRGFTHLFNAMSPLTTREPGTVGAALDDPGTWAGIIADGHHVHPALIRLAHGAKGPEKLFLVSDAMATVGSDELSFEIYGETITLHQGRLVNGEGKLAGSAIGMIDAVRIAHRQARIALEECLRMASLYPAAFLGRDEQLGRLAPGYRADLVCFRDDFTVTDTWVAGAHHPVD